MGMCRIIPLYKWVEKNARFVYHSPNKKYHSMGGFLSILYIFYPQWTLIIITRIQIFLFIKNGSSRIRYVNLNIIIGHIY